MKKLLLINLLLLLFSACDNKTTYDDPQDQKINDMQDEINNQQNKIDDMQSDIDDMQSDIDDMK